MSSPLQARASSNTAVLLPDASARALSHTHRYYDYLKVERAWKITPPASTVEEYNAFCEDVRANAQKNAVRHAWQECQVTPQQVQSTPSCRPAGTRYYHNPLLNLTTWNPPGEASNSDVGEGGGGARQQLLQLRAEHAEAVNRLQGECNAAEEKVLEPLKADINETLLLHGTKPATVTSILARNLDPQLAQSGLFGRGTYFAEHPSKIDQYTTVDREWEGGQRNYSSSLLHNTLYPTADLHPGNACYALVCRVVLDDPYVTRETMPFDWKPPPGVGVHSLLAEHGVGNGGFREFVIFDRRGMCGPCVRCVCVCVCVCVQPPAHAARPLRLLKPVLPVVQRVVL